MSAMIAIKLRLRDKHCSELNRQARAINFVWNYVNDTARKAWNRDRRWLTNYDLQKLTSGSSAELGLHSGSIQRVCAVHAESRTARKTPALRWRGKKSLGWIPFKKGQISFDGTSITFRSMSFEPMHLNPKLVAGALISSGSFNSDARGRWYINMPVQVECANSAPLRRVGIDLGLSNLASLSDGINIVAPKLFRASEKTLATLQRARKSAPRIRSLHAKIANRRKDFLHKASAKIAAEYGLIVVGDVSPSKIARTNLAKSVLDAGWSNFKRMLSYKAIMHGGSVLEVSERNTSRMCSRCGVIPGSSPKGRGSLGMREWRCDNCNAIHDRDVNAATNILRMGLHTLVGGTHA